MRNWGRTNRMFVQQFAGSPIHLLQTVENPVHQAAAAVLLKKPVAFRLRFS